MSECEMAAEITSETLHTIFDGTACPECGCTDGSRVKTTVLGLGSFIRSCSVCNWTTGVDDSVNLCDFGEENWEFEPTDGESSPCLENTNHHPVYMGFSESGLMRSRCMKCKKTGIMFYKGQDINTRAGEFQDIDCVFGTILKNILGESDVINNESRLVSDVLQEIAENDKLAECMPTPNVAQEDEMVCDCDNVNGNAEYFNQIHDSSDTAMEITCLQRDAEHSPDLDSGIDCVICENCNNNAEDCFEKTYESGRLVQIQCFQCNAKFSANLELDANYIFCENCNNKVEEDCFEKMHVSGKLTQIKCLPCENVQRLSETRQRTFENIDYLHVDRVTSWEMIERGNHISWQRDLSYKHHAILLSIDPTARKVKIIEYGVNCTLVDRKPTFARVQEREEIINDLGKIFLYRYDYDPENCYLPEEVIERAQSRIGERKYNVFARNCEHFATWCKTGKEYCSQIVPLVKRVGHAAVAFVTQLSRPVINLIKDEVFQMIITGAAVDDVVDYTVQQIARMKVDSAFKVGRIGFTVLLNLVVELWIFYNSYKKVEEDFANGRITKTEFRKCRMELIGESSGGLTLGLLLGFTWLLGLGIVGTLILNILGIVGGRLLGAWIGRKLHNCTVKA